MTFRTISLLGFSALVGLAACSSVEMDDGQYWQRVTPSESIYAEGPKAQQMLNRDISRCVVELRELEALGSIKHSIPTDANGKILDPDEKDKDTLEDWDTPERDGYLLAEHKDYSDFDGCMLASGWERIKYVPYDVSERSQRNWYKAHVDYGYDPRNAPLQPAVTEDGLND
jgi:hypothetical protein